MIGADVHGQTPTPRRAQTQGQLQPHRNPALEIVTGSAAGLPPELAADALIRIASSPRVTDREWKRELLTEAFFRAYSARDPYRHSTPQPVPPDTSEGARLFAR